jgi:hypothetical protein
LKELAERYTYKDGRLISKVTGNFGDTQLNSAGYRRVSWDRGNKGRVREFAHRVIWYIHNGDIPEGYVVDHRNGNHLDNRIENLRMITQGQNLQNVRKRGYCWDRRARKFRTEITLNQKCTALGFFNTKEEAREAYLKAKRKLHMFAEEHVLND